MTQRVVRARDAVTAEIHRRFVQHGERGTPKHVQLRGAIQSAIEDGVLAPGAQIPPEIHLTSSLGISLGTVRRALDYLAIGGFVTREHGRGTFIADHRGAIEDSWHYRFVAPDGQTVLPAYSQIIDRDVVRDAGSWSATLGTDASGYVRIKRCVNIGNSFLCYSEFYLRRSRFGKMLKLPLSRLENVNLKNVLNAEFKAPTVYVRQWLRVQRFPTEIYDLLSMRKGTHGLFLQIVAYTYDNTPITHHEIYVPPTQLLLDLSAHDLFSQVPAVRNRAL